MRPISQSQNALSHPLSALLRSESHTRVLRVLALTDQLIGAPEIARLANLTPLGARKALNRLAKTGFVLTVGGGRKKSYGFDRSDSMMDPMIDRLIELFRAERERYDELLRQLKSAVDGLQKPVQTSWINRPDNYILTKASIGFIGRARDVATQKRQLQEALVPIERRFNLTIDVAGYTKADIPEIEFVDVTLLTGWAVWASAGDDTALLSHRQLDERALQWAQRVAELIQNDPSIVSRALHHLDKILRVGQGSADHDLREWRNILSHYPPLRIRQFLVDDSQRANRLRQSSPFLAVLDDEERKYVLSGEADDET
jgi:hypothetical protein